MRKGHGSQKAIGLGVVTAGIAHGGTSYCKNEKPRASCQGSVCVCHRPPILIPKWDWAGCAVGVYKSAVCVYVVANKNMFLQLH